MDTVKILGQLFSGREDCFGTYHLNGSPEPGKKWEGKAISYPNSTYPYRGLEFEDYKAHFNGKIALGIVPVLLDGTCKWFAIDVDDYKIDHTSLAKNISHKNIPLVHCRSKSGGAHLYGVTSEPIKATDAMLLAKKWCAELGFDPKRTEIFPKQTKFDSPEAKGNWIIIPYFGGEAALDFAIDDTGKKVSFKHFPQFVEARLFNRKEALEFIKDNKTMSKEDILAESPPCVIAMMEQGLKEGDGRNNAASHLSWYYRKIDEYFETTDWKDSLNHFNQTYFDPPMSYQELNQIIKNHSGGKYKARCEVNPMAVMCDKPSCLKRKFGIKAENSFSEFQITAITKINFGDDPLWKVFVNGQSVTMTTETIMNPRRFRQAVLAKTNMLIPALKQNDHDAFLAPVIKDALVIEEAEIASNYGKIDSCFKQWISQVIEKSREPKKVLDGLPFYSKSDHEIWFRLHDFVLEYRRVYKEQVDDKEIYVVLKAANFLQRSININERPFELMTFRVPENEIWFSIDKEEKF